MKPYTPKQVIVWLKRFKATKDFSWFNLSECGCLFTQFHRFKHRKSKHVVGIGGTMTGIPGQPFPFHDRFWNRVKGKNRTTVTAGKAIRILKSL
jgi:hypothetical protein